MYSCKFKASSTLLVLAGFFSAAEGVWSMAASGVFKDILGASYVLMQEQSLVLIGIVVILSVIGIRGAREFLMICIVFLSIGFYEYAVSCFFGTELYGFRQFVFGFLYPVMLMFLMLRTQNQNLFFRSYYIGYIVFICSALTVLLFFDDNFNMIRQGSVGEIVISLRNTYKGSLFFLVVGNANKQSNYLLMSILLGPALLELKCSDRLYSIFVVFAVILLFLLCSRATLMLLPIALYLNRAYFIPPSRTIKIFLWIGAGFLLVVFFQELVTIFSYVVFNVRFDQDAVDVLGSFHSRFAQWGEIQELVSDPWVLFHGIGVGNYGLLIENGSEQLGTHNLFLDHLVSSGLYGPLVLASIIGFGVMRSIRLADKRLLIAYVFFVCLAFREYSFAYVYVTSMGGLIFSFMLYLTFNTRVTKVFNFTGQDRVAYF